LVNFLQCLREGIKEKRKSKKSKTLVDEKEEELTSETEGTSSSSKLMRAPKSRKKAPKSQKKKFKLDRVSTNSPGFFSSIIYGSSSSKQKFD